MPRVALQGLGYRVTIAMMPKTVGGEAGVDAEAMRAVISTSYAEHSGLQTNQAGMLLLVNRNYRGTGPLTNSKQHANLLP